VVSPPFPDIFHIHRFGFNNYVASFVVSVVIIDASYRSRRHDNYDAAYFISQQDHKFTTRPCPFHGEQTLVARIKNMQQVGEEQTKKHDGQQGRIGPSKKLGVHVYTR
jgi:hypothetical protein